ncbi:S-layer homology domain-containing protein [Paenibacillus rigui]|uniref:SLH domain-containing protein n=1 Tax=Paenibacillus rigui TaxID=554312 RepID=A0A229UI25_9BACL|nr:S-layer homology domain-containing protein [Paenibacillus rigui]OXM83014.1 hypothetical protein CF651_27745 [Paenibacillus rigui]
MRRWAVLLLSFLMCFGMMIPSALASAPTISALYDENTGRVMITGTLGSAQGTIVTVQVIDPLNQLDYIKQAVTGANGTYQFSYKLKQRINGTFTVTVSGQSEEQVNVTTFEVKMSVSVALDGVRNLIVSGYLGVSEGNKYTVRIVNPMGNEEYRQDGVTGANGAYSINYSIQNRIIGNYMITVNGQRPDAVASASYYMSETDRKKHNGGGGSSSNSTSSTTNNPTPETPSLPPVQPLEKPDVKISPEVKMDKASGTASASLSSEDAINAAGANVVVEMKETVGANKYQLYLPASLLMSSSDKKITVVTELGSVTVPQNMLENESLEPATEVSLAVGRADKAALPAEVQEKVGNKPVIELTITAGGKRITYNNPDAPVTVSVLYQPTAEELKDPEHIVVWFISNSGNVQPVPSGKYDSATGTVTFTTTHFTTYAVAFVMKTFADLDSVGWAKKQIEVMAAKGIISGTTETAFNPGANITRADFMILLTKTFGFTAAVRSNFNDVLPTDYYYEAVGIAKLDLTNGQEDGTFNPDEPISRQDMMVLLSRAMKLAGKLDTQGSENDLAAFDDKANVADYAVQGVASLIKGGVVEGSGNMLNPMGNSTRAEAAVMLYRIYNK